ncbi:MAG: acyloxyacyl hydrolase [Candidatus Omnitrophota bacterium]
MKQRFQRMACIGLIAIIFFIPSTLFAEKSEEGIGKWLQEVGVFAGYVSCGLKGQDDFQAVTTGMRFGFDLKPFTKKFGFEPKGMLELLYEPFISYISQPKDNADLGLGIMFRYSYPLTEKFYPYVEGGSGLYYMTLKTREQGSQFNFVDQAGGGFLFFLKENIALNAGYRIRHVSNFSVEQPNDGIDGHVISGGVSIYY